MSEDLILKKLDITDLKNLIDLQDKIIADLKEDEQHFILHRTASDFLNALESDSTYVFGLYDGDRLVSQSILSLPKNGDKREISEFLSERKNSELAVYKAVLVDPAYRGRGLMKRMLRTREEAAIMNGRNTAITQIAADNPASWVNALRYGMQITQVGTDPEDGAKVIYLQKRLDGKKEPLLDMAQSFAMPLGQDIHKHVQILFNKMQKLSAEGWVATNLIMDKSGFKLMWHPLEKVSHLKEIAVKKTEPQQTHFTMQNQYGTAHFQR
ncbi:MAG: GNAT family N-acetyltransferase [Alphaproteobacteria bacterium]|nr:GNAT family N-acetyltransferase [Alphaproteobacteria bacterium]